MHRDGQATISEEKLDEQRRIIVEENIALRAEVAELKAEIEKLSDSAQEAAERHDCDSRDE